MSWVTPVIDRESPLAVERPDAVEKIHLMPMVQKGRGLVQEHEPRLLGKGPCDEHPLVLSAGKRLHVPSCKAERVRHLHGLAGDPFILLALEAPAPQGGDRPMSTTSSTEKGKARAAYCGTTATDWASTSRRSFPISVPSRKPSPPGA